MKIFIQSLVILIFLLFSSEVFAQNNSWKLAKAQEKMDYYLSIDKHKTYDAIKEMPYDLPWSNYQNLTEEQVNAIKAFLDNEKQWEEDKIYRFYEIVYEEYQN